MCIGYSGVCVQGGVKFDRRIGFYNESNMGTALSHKNINERVGIPGLNVINEMR